MAFLGKGYEEQTGAGLEKGELKTGSSLREAKRALLSVQRLNSGARKMESISLDLGDWTRFVYSRKGPKLEAWQTRSATMPFVPTHPPLWPYGKDTTWEAVPKLQFCPLTLSPPTTCLHSLEQDIHETEEMTSHCQACAWFLLFLSYRHH